MAKQQLIKQNFSTHSPRDGPKQSKQMYRAFGSLLIYRMQRDSKE